MHSIDVPSVETRTDFIISRFRRNFGIWFDINDYSRHSVCVNQASLTNGRSFLNIYCSLIHKYQDSWLSIDLGDDAILSIFGNWSSDSRDFVSVADLRRAAQLANAEYETMPQSQDAASRVVLLSLEITFNRDRHIAKRWLDLMATTLKGNMTDLPRYDGLAADIPGFEVSEDPVKQWSQLVFENPIQNCVVEAFIGRWLRLKSSPQAINNRQYTALPELEQRFGITSVQALSRRY